MIIKGYTPEDEPRVSSKLYRQGYDPGFVLTDNNGNNAEPGGKLGCVLYTVTHYNTNSYTARYVYDTYNEKGQKIPPDESVSAESLRNSFTTEVC